MGIGSRHDLRGQGDVIGVSMTHLFNAIIIVVNCMKIYNNEYMLYTC